MGRFLGPYLKHFIFFVTYNGPNKLEYYITPGWKSLLLTNTLAYSANLYVTKKMQCCEYGPICPHSELMFTLYIHMFVCMYGHQ
jgi:hypothetical protein